jgi:hypothetical protein
MLPRWPPVIPRGTGLGLGAAVTPFALGMPQAAAGTNLLVSGVVALVASLVP